MIPTSPLIRTALLLLLAAVAAGSGEEEEEEFAFSAGYYEGWAPEFAVGDLAEVTSSVMMGMRVTPASRHVEFEAVPASDDVEVTRETVADFHFLRMRVTDAVDAEERPLMDNRTVTVRARAGRRETYCRVHLHMHDTNNIRPYFRQRRYEATISEDSPVGTPIVSMHAYDRDRERANKLFYYALAHDTSNFAIHPTSGRVLLSAPVSHRLQPVHSVDIFAVDRGTGGNRSANLIVHVTAVNRHAPLIALKPLAYSDASLNRTLAVLECSDADSGANGRLGPPHIVPNDDDALEYVELLPGGAPGDFLINLRRHPPTQRTLNFTVRVSDRGTPPRTTERTLGIPLPVENAYTPVFASGDEAEIEFTASEWCQPGTHIGFVEATVPYGSSVGYELDTDDQDSRFFTVGRRSGLLRLARPLDRERRESHVMGVWAYNDDAVGNVASYRRRVTVRVTVEDANDNDPRFAQAEYAVELEEGDAYVGRRVLTVHATDADRGENGTVTYQLVDGDGLPVEVDHLTGDLTVTGKLDSDSRISRRFLVRIRAQDGGRPFPRTCDTLVAVTVDDVNDRAPQFDYRRCDIEFPLDRLARSSSDPALPVIDLNPYDVDPVRDRPMSCYVSGRDVTTDGLFFIPPASCVLRLNATAITPHRALRHGAFNMTVVASDSQLESRPVPVSIRFVDRRRGAEGSRCPRTARPRPDSVRSYSGVPMSTAALRNDYPPEVSRKHALQRARVPENAAVGTGCLRVRARDIDKLYNGLLWFTLLPDEEEDDDANFRIDHLTGEVFVARSLDRELKSEHRLLIGITDLASDPSRRRSIEVRARVTVADVNDNPPRFPLRSYQFALAENATVTSSEMRVGAEDDDAGANAEVRYAVDDLRAIDFRFAIDAESGAISLNGSLDRESRDTYSFRVTAYDRGEPSLRTSVPVTIRISDVNDNPPRFSRARYELRIAEDMPRYTVVYWLRAVDADVASNARVWYTLAGGDDDTFIIDTYSGAVRLMAPLSHARKPVYELDIRARDVDDRLAECRLVVRLLPVNHNRHRPRFSAYERVIEVGEDAPPGTTVGTVRARDDDRRPGDGDVTYHVIGGDGIGIFAVDKYTGEITVRQMLDREERKYHWLTIAARDGGLVPLEDYMHVALVVIDVNDNVPMSLVPVYHCRVTEGGGAGELVVEVNAVDRDEGANGKFGYEIVDDRTSAFRINSKNGKIYTTRSLERWGGGGDGGGSLLSFKVRMTDRGSPPLSSEVPVFVRVAPGAAGTNDGRVIFAEELAAQLRLVTPQRVGQKLFRVHARSTSGANVTYELAGDATDGALGLAIDPRTGVVRCSALRRHRKGATTIQVLASAGAARASSDVTVTWLVASSYSSGRDERPTSFAFDTQEVECEERMTSSPVLLQRLDVTNDHRDHKQLRFDITGGDDEEEELFYLHPSTGDLWLMGGVDAEVKDRYELVVRLSDGGSSVEAKVVINISDLNDNPPVFETPIYRERVSEGAAPGSLVVKLRAHDADATAPNRRLRYLIVGTRDTNSRARFSLDPLTGVLTTAARLDRERQSVHELVVRVDDRGTPPSMQDYCHVIITLDDVNEHAPAFTSDRYRARYVIDQADVTDSAAPWHDAIGEGAERAHTGIYELGGASSVGDVIAVTSASDPDHGRNGKVFYSIVQGNEDGVWRIDPTTGAISSRRLPPLDPNLERRDEVLVIEARDDPASGEPLRSRAHVTIEIARSRDAAPMFDARRYGALLSEDAAVGSIVARVRATGSAGVSYVMSSETEDDVRAHFRLDASSGIVTLVRPVDFETRETWEVGVEAHSGEVAAYSSATLVIHVTDVNDNRPVLDRVSYEARVSGHVTSSEALTPLLTSAGEAVVIEASDADGTGDNSLLRFRIVDDDAAKRFAVDESTGAVMRVNDGDDGTETSEFSFEVEVSDRGVPPLTALRRARVVVRVVPDPTDRSYRFERDRYQLRIDPPFVAGFLLPLRPRLLQNHPHVGAEEPIFTLVDEADRDKLEIDPRTGELTLRDGDFDVDGQMNVRIAAALGDEVVASTTVRIGIGAAVGTFDKSYRARVPENVEEPRVVVSLAALVPDIGTEVDYVILNPDPRFRLSGAAFLVTGNPPLDRETKASHVTMIEARVATGYGTEATRRRLRVTVDVADENDNPPRLLGTPLGADVRKDAAAGTSVMRVRATDADEGANGRIGFHLEGSHAHLFAIDHVTGDVTTRSSLAAINSDRLQLSVVASDGGEPFLMSSAPLHVRPVDDNSPRFLAPPPPDPLRISENLIPGALVSDVVKARGGGGGRDVISYAIAGGDPRHEFDIDFSTGTILTRRSLDREKCDTYRLLVRAFTPSSASYAEMTLTVKVDDANDNAPRFTSDAYTARVAENVPVGTDVIQVKASDGDVGENGDVTYSIVTTGGGSDDLEGLFEIDHVTGWLRVARSLDREALGHVIRLVTRASDSGIPSPLYSDVEVTVEIDDVNDNPPRFPTDNLELVASSEACSSGGEGFAVGRLTAHDPDPSSYGKLRFSLQTSHPLRIDPVSGIVLLRNDDRSDVTAAVNGSEYRAQAIVDDGIFSSSASLVVRLLRERPRAVECDGDVTAMTIDEEAEVNTMVGRVGVTYGGDDVTFALETSDSRFRVDALTGAIHTQEGVAGGAGTVPLVVTASSQGATVRCRVAVRIDDVNGHVPAFERDSYEAVVVAGTSHVGGHVTRVRARDGDGDEWGRVGYEWDDPGDVTSHFALDRVTGDVTLRKEILLTETRNLFSFYVKAVDGGGRSSVVGVTVYIAGPQDPLPHFDLPLHHLTLPEDAPRGHMVVTLHARLPTDDRELHYKLVTTTADDKFAVGRTDGRLTVLDKLDRESEARYELVVVAYVRTTPELVSETRVVIELADVNDNRPRFDSPLYRVSVVENSPPEAPLLRVGCSDPDAGENGRVVYRLLDDREERRFAVDEETGEVTMTSALDREADDVTSSGHVEVGVTCSDGGGLESSARVRVDVIDVNDSPPTFGDNSHQFVISTAARAGYETEATMVARDADPSTHQQLISVQVIGAQTTGATFEPYLGTIGRDTRGVTIPIGLRLLRAFDDALDRDDGVYYVTIELSDGVHRSNATARVTWSEDRPAPIWSPRAPVCHKLVYEAEVSENCETGTKVVAIDLRPGAGRHQENFRSRLVYTLTGDGHEDFEIDPATATVLTRRVLDRETRPLYRLLLTVAYLDEDDVTTTTSSDDVASKRCELQVRISIGDVNDNSPRIGGEKPVRISVREDALVGSVLHKMVATDPDEGANSTLNYVLTDDGDGQFAVGAVSGLVTLQRGLDRESVPSYELGVRVTDGGGRSTSSRVIVRVIDVNDNPPLFYQTSYNATVSEDWKIGHEVAVVSAYSLDDGANGQLRYAISGGNERGKFSIDSRSGRVELADEVDYETERSYVIKICAEDVSENPLRSETSLHVRVLDVNDNSPRFLSVNSPIYVDENAEAGTVVTQFQARDIDAGEAGHVTYSLERDDEDIPFRMDERTGRLVVRRPPDRERRAEYRLRVVAVDGGSPRLSGIVEAVVRVSDANDEAPVVVVERGADGVEVTCRHGDDDVTRRECEATVHENDHVISGIVAVSAVDRDTGSGNAAPFRFRLYTGSDDDDDDEEEENGEFYLDEDNRLRSRSKLQVDALSTNPIAQHHDFRVVATDAGGIRSRPMYLRVTVLKESKYDPKITPQKITVVTGQDEFESGMISRRIHATDRDPYDEGRLRFRILNPDDFDLFTLNPLNGSLRLISSLPASASLTSPTRNVTVLVSDGSRSSEGGVQVRVAGASEEALSESVEVNFGDVEGGGETYLERMHVTLALTLMETLPHGFDPDRDMEIISLQEQGDGLKLLFSVRKIPEDSAASTIRYFPSRSLSNLLDQSRTLLEERLGVRVGEIVGADDCTMPECAGTCRYHIRLGNASSRLPITSRAWSLLTPDYSRAPSCVCPKGHVGRACTSVCLARDDLCPGGHECHLDGTEASGYRCARPDLPPNIAAFGGNSRQRYVTVASRSPFAVNFRFRTRQPNGTLLRADGTDGSFARFQTASGLVRFAFDCGGGGGDGGGATGIQTMHQRVPTLDDGNWHDVEIAPLSGGDCAYRVVIDGKYEATSTAGTEGSRPRQLIFDRLIVGGDEDPDSGGFVGCFEDLKVGGELVDKSRQVVTKVSEELVLDRCPAQLGSCHRDLCENGGRCVLEMRRSGSKEAIATPLCACASGFTGLRCEIEHACGALPCRNHGVCHSSGARFTCHCKPGFAGRLCERACPPGFTGAECRDDLDECSSAGDDVICGSGGTCHNYQGGFACNCTRGYAPDPNCVRVSAAGGGFPTVTIVVAVAVASLAIVASVLAAWWCRRRGRERRRGSVATGDKFIMHHIANSVTSSASRHHHHHHRAPTSLTSSSIPPIPQRPADYQRCSRGSMSDAGGGGGGAGSPLLLQSPGDPPTRPINSASSESSSLHKPPASWVDYQGATSGSSSLAKMPPAASPVRHHRHLHRSQHSIGEQQHYAWDVSDWIQTGDGGGGGDVSDHVTSVPVHRTHHRHQQQSRDDDVSSVASSLLNYPLSSVVHHRLHPRHAAPPGGEHPHHPHARKRDRKSRSNNLAAPGTGGDFKSRRQQQQQQRALLTSDSSNATEKNFADSERDDSEEIVPLGYEELARLSSQVPRCYARRHDDVTAATVVDDDDDEVDYEMPAAAHARSYSSLLRGNADVSDDDDDDVVPVTRKSRFHPDMYLPTPHGLDEEEEEEEDGSLTRNNDDDDGVVRSRSLADRMVVADQLAMSSLSDLDEDRDLKWPLPATAGAGGDTNV